VLFPQQASLFYAGRIAPNLGAFVQMTYDGTSASFGWDNTDIRYASLASDKFLWGVSFNNNPTVQDPWNSTPAWQVPFDQRSATAPTPSIATALDGGLTDAGVAGMSVYGFWNDSVYVELGGYKAAPAASQLDSSIDAPVLDGIAPYWRVAYEHQWGRYSWEAGAYGVTAKLFPGGGPLSGPTDRFKDWAIDSQLQYIGDQHLFSILGTYIDETRNMDATGGGLANASDKVKTLRIGGNYYYQRKYGVALGYFSTTGSEDAELYQPAIPLTGFANNKPDSNGWIGELDWVPYQNTKIALQYITYNKFNGGGSMYDGVSRSASDNNTLYLLGWLNF